MDCTAEYLRAFTSAYIRTALWETTADKPGEETNCPDSLEDQGYTPDDIAHESLAVMQQEAAAFFHANRESIGTHYRRAAQDLWLTRNRCGCGFRDEGATYGEEAAHALMQAAHAAGERTLYIGDDMRVHHCHA
jgi:hypothetical protein